MSEPTAQDFLSRKKAAAFLSALGCPIAPSTLAKKAQNNNEGGGPPFLKSGWRTVRYLKDDLREWAASVMVRVR